MNRAERRSATRQPLRPARTKRPAAAPMLVMQYTNPMELHERMSVEAIIGGWATTEHFDNLADAHDILNLAAADKGDAATLAVCELTGIALLNIKDRWLERAKFGVTGEERKALELLAETSRDFWARQSGAFFHGCFIALRKLRKFQKEKLEAA